MDFRSLGSDILKYMFNKWIELGKSVLADYDVLDVSFVNFEKNLCCQLKYGCINFL